MRRAAHFSARLPILLFVAALGPRTTCAALSPAQPTGFTLGPDGAWKPKDAPAPGSDAEVLANAARLLAEGRPQAALPILDDFIEQRALNQDAPLAEAYLRRGDAKTALGDEYKALYDYEFVIKNYTGTPEFVLALERELEIGVRYLNGLRRKFFGLRIDGATDVGEELLLRVQERLPGSQLAERAGIELADHYYRVRDLPMAAEAYDVFLQSYPQSEYRLKAMLRRIFANIARFKGPQYDVSGLVEAQFLIRQFGRLYPAEAEQAGVNDALSARLDESAGAQMLENARWYLLRDDEVSARFMIKRLLRRHPETVAARRAAELAKERGWALDAPKSPSPLPADAPTQGPPSAPPGPDPSSQTPAAETSR